MTPVRDLDGRQAQEIEEQLFTTHRQQLQRHVPIPLPRQDFWVMVRALLSSLDLEIQDMVRKGSIDMRLQNLQKRQTNIRRIASELARKRMVAMMQHAASQSLRSGVNPNMAQELPQLDWQRHDPAEKAFYHALQLNVDRFKKEIDWQGMQQGLLGEIMMQPRTHAPGTMQLDAFTEEGKITQQPPPDLAFEDGLEPIEMMQDDLEDRLMGEASWMDEEAYMMSDMTSDPPTNTLNRPHLFVANRQQNTVQPWSWPLQSSRLSTSWTSLRKESTTRRPKPRLFKRTAPQNQNRMKTYGCASSKPCPNPSWMLRWRSSVPRGRGRSFPRRRDSIVAD